MQIILLFPLRPGVIWRGIITINHKTNQLPESSIFILGNDTAARNVTTDLKHFYCVNFSLKEEAIYICSRKAEKRTLRSTKNSHKIRIFVETFLAENLIPSLFEHSCFYSFSHLCKLGLSSYQLSSSTTCTNIWIIVFCHLSDPAILKRDLV